MATVVSHTPSYQIYLSHFRMFAPKCAACQMPIAPQPVSCSAVLADEGEEGVGRLVRVDEEGYGEGVGVMVRGRGGGKREDVARFDQPASST